MKPQSRIMADFGGGGLMFDRSYFLFNKRTQRYTPMKIGKVNISTQQRHLKGTMSPGSTRKPYLVSVYLTTLRVTTVQTSNTLDYLYFWTLMKSHSILLYEWLISFNMVLEFLHVFGYNCSAFILLPCDILWIPQFVHPSSVATHLDVSGLRYFKECLNEPPYACLFVSLSLHLCMLQTREGNAGS